VVTVFTGLDFALGQVLFSTQSENARLSMSITIDKLWNHGTDEDWRKCFDDYWEQKSVKNNYDTEKYFEEVDVEKIKIMPPKKFYKFLIKYFQWKYTAKNRLATTLKYFEKYNTEDEIVELAEIKNQLFSFNTSVPTFNQIKLAS
jgi:hypothetical protein